MKTELEAEICRLFRYKAPIVFVTGRYDFGKTDFSLYIAETLLKYGVIKRFATNIKVLDSLGYDYTYITNLVDLRKWVKNPKHVSKLFILDEAGVNVDRRNPLGKLNREIRHLGFLLRKYRGRLIFVSQRAKDIESTFEDTDIWLATFKKTSRTTARLITNVDPDPIEIFDIPPTSFKFDTYDIAPFTTEPTSFNADTLERKILLDWLEHGKYSRTAKKFNLHIQQVKRIILKEVKALLSE